MPNLDIPQRPSLPMVKKNQEQIANRFENSNQTTKALLKIVKIQKPKRVVMGFRLLPDEKQFIESLATSNEVSPKDVLSEMIKEYRDNHNL